MKYWGDVHYKNAHISKLDFEHYYQAILIALLKLFIYIVNWLIMHLNCNLAAK